jgi:hypothetical protein
MSLSRLAKKHLHELSAYLEDALQTSIQTIDFLQDRVDEDVAEMQPVEIARLNDRLHYERGYAKWLKGERNEALGRIKKL